MLYPISKKLLRAKLKIHNAQESHSTWSKRAHDVKFDVITANPPYVTADEMNDLEPELAHEPAHALTDGGDGMSILCEIIRIYKHHLTPCGTMILEHGWQQGEQICQLAEENGMTYEPIFDYGGHCRGAILKHK